MGEQFFFLGMNPACPISKADFLTHADSLVMDIESHPIAMNPKEFTPGSFGWNGSGRIKVPVDGHELSVQVSVNATVLKSKEAPSESIKLSDEATVRAPAIKPLAVPSHSLKELVPVQEVLFFPDESDNSKLRRVFTFLAAAQTSIDVCVFAFTDARLVDVLLGAHQRGVRVRMIVDDRMTLMASSKAAYMIEQGVDVVMDNSPFHMHHKFAIVDDQVLLSGSFNWTVQAQRSNRENLQISSDATMIQAYRGEFDTLWKEYAKNPKPKKPQGELPQKRTAKQPQGRSKQAKSK